MTLGVKVFKTAEGARKSASFSTNHCGGRWIYTPVRCIGPANEPDTAEFDPKIFHKYTWRIMRKSRERTP